MTAVAEVLQRATLKVIGSPDSADFKLDVGMDGSSGGKLHSTVLMNGDGVAFNFGYDPDSQPTNPASVRTVLDALEEADAFTVYYDSGHIATQKGIWRYNTNVTPFPNWRFLDFSGFDITAEKPGSTPQQIHSLARSNTDRSPFRTAVHHDSS